jgi:hypothetical protein
VGSVGQEGKGRNLPALMWLYSLASSSDVDASQYRRNFGKALILALEELGKIFRCTKATGIG